MSETPNTIIDIPKQNIAKSNFLPAFLVRGIWAEATIIKTEPTAGAALKIPKQDLDPTFIASVFTGVLATFGVQAGKSKSNGSSGGGANISKKDMEILIEKASQTAPAQVVRIEQAPVKIIPDQK